MVLQHRAEDHQVEDGGKHRRADGLEADLPEAQHFLVEQRRRAGEDAVGNRRRWGR